MKIIPANAQHIGRRAEQQDAFGFSDNSDQTFVKHSGFLAVLCDGMGGMALGEQVSNAAVQSMLKAYMEKNADQLIVEALQEALQAANQAVLTVAEEAGLEGEAGTTLVAALVHDEQLHWISVGDSRVYLLRDGDITQMTEDHNYAMELEVLVQQNRISREQADQDAERQSLVSYLGLPELPYISASNRPLTLQAGDIVLLCSDGLYGTVAPEELKELLRYHRGDPYALVQAVLAKENPRQDNITVTMLICGELARDTVRNADRDIKSKQSNRRTMFTTLGAIVMTLAIGVGIYYYALYNAQQNNSKTTAVIDTLTEER